VTARTRAEVFDLKRRRISEYLAAGDLLRGLLGSDSAPEPEDVDPLAARREQIQRRIQRLDGILSSLESTDPAAEVLASTALARALKRAVEQDELILEAMGRWHGQLADALTRLQQGKKSLAAYETKQPTELSRPTVSTAA